MPLATIHVLRTKELVIRCHGLLGAIYLDALQNDPALYHYIQAHKLAEEIHDTNLTVTSLALMGDVLRQQNDKATAISYMENAREQAVNANKATLGHILQLLPIPIAILAMKLLLSKQFQKQRSFLPLQVREETL